ncbi:T9SS type A sorting domain-containing protein, partial [Mangrovibacterium diazotrophicum]
YVCYEDNEVTLTATPSGGSGSYSYLWSTGATTASISVSPTSDTNYSVTVTDTGFSPTNGVACSATDDVDVIVNPAISVDAGTDVYVCYEDNEVTLTATPSGGSGSYSYLWSTGATTASITVSPTSDTNYSVTVTDTGFSPTNGVACSATDDVDVIVNPAISVDAGTDVYVCYEDNEVTLTATPSGGSGSYSYLWSTGATTASITVSPTSDTNYSVTVTDTGFSPTAGVACSATDDVDVIVNPPISCSTKVLASAECEGPNGSAEVTPSGGTPGYTYLWDNGETTAVATALTPGLHEVEVWDSKNCPTSCEVTIPNLPCDHIFPTQTTCCHYRTESATQLYNVCYTPSKKKGGTVGNAVPGVFFYYTYVVAPSSSFDIRVDQGNDGALDKLFSVAQLDIKLFDEDCDKLSTVEVSVDGTDNSVAHMSVSGATAGVKYVLGVKYDVKSIIGASYTSPAPTSSYWFKTYIDDGSNPEYYEVGSTGMIDAVPNCTDNTPLPGNCSLAQASTLDASQTFTTLSLKSATTITAYPNPFSDNITFEFTANQDGKATIEMFNMFGQKVATVLKQLVTEGEFVKVTYAPEGIVSGTYIYRFILGDTVLNGELIYQEQK